MKVEKLLDSIREYQNFRSDPDDGIGPSTLTKMENVLFCSIMNSLTCEQQEAAMKYITDGFHLSLYKFVPHVHPEQMVKKNEKIETVLARFIDKKSRRVSESRKELMSRYPYQSFADQKKIVRAFLESNSVTDIEWAAYEADRRWDKSYEDPLLKAFQRKKSDKLAITVIRKMPLDYVRSQEKTLVMHSRVEFCIRLAGEAESLMQKYALNIFERLYVYARTGIKSAMSEEQIDRRFFRFLLEFSRMVQSGIYTDYKCLDDVPWIRRTLWAMGQLGYSHILIRFFRMLKYVLNETAGNADNDHFHYMEKWIIRNCFQAAKQYGPIDISKIMDRINEIDQPESIRIESLEDLGKYGDLPEGIADTLSEFI